jgi:hypothetical protein
MTRHAGYFPATASWSLRAWLVAMKTHDGEANQEYRSTDEDAYPVEATAYSLRCAHWITSPPLTGCHS